MLQLSHVLLCHILQVPDRICLAAETVILQYYVNTIVCC
jgi:hypothetical protein